MDDARAAADRAVLGVGLVLATAQVDEQLLGLTTERAHELGAGSLLLQGEPQNAIKSARSPIPTDARGREC